QLFFRFDNAERAVELRARYFDGPAAGKDARWMKEVLSKITKRAGAPSEAPSPWAKLWADLPPQKPAPVLYRWQDDQSILVYQRVAPGLEVAFRDGRRDGETGLPLTPGEYLPGGLATLHLGDQQQKLFQSWNVPHPVIAGEGAVVLRPPQGSPYDALLV